MQSCEECAKSGPEPCFSCFDKRFLKRARAALKSAGFIQKGEVVSLFDDGTINTAVAVHALKAIVKGLPFTLEKSTTPSGKTIWPYSADDLVNMYWEAVVSGKQPHLPQGILLLSKVLQNEVHRYAKGHALEGKPHVQSDFAQKINALDEKYPGMKHSLVNSAVFIEQLLEQHGRKTESS